MLENIRDRPRQNSHRLLYRILSVLTDQTKVIQPLAYLAATRLLPMNVDLALAGGFRKEESNDLLFFRAPKPHMVGWLGNDETQKPKLFVK